MKSHGALVLCVSLMLLVLLVVFLSSSASDAIFFAAVSTECERVP